MPPILPPPPSPLPAPPPPPCTSPATSAASPRFVVDRINARFNAGRPSNDLCAAGVLVHAFDGHLDASAPWRVNAAGWMEQYGRILSASLINARKAGTFNGDGGVVLSAASGILCAYPYDGGAMNYANGCGPTSCAEPDHIWGCAFPPQMLYRMLQIHESGPQWPYNEVVVDADRLVIEAVYGTSAAARDVHARLRAHFGASAAQLPLLDFRGGARDPFVLVST